MHKLFIALLFALSSSAIAKEYGHYDTKRLLTTSETPTGKKYGFDRAYLDQMLNDLSAHAGNYPPHFDTPDDKQRATVDVQNLSGMLDILVNVPSPHPELLLRAAYLNSMGHNLEIPGAADKANSNFQRLLAATPSHPRGSYFYGTFLANVGKPNEALPYLEKALAAGISDAAYSIGLTHLALGNQQQALKSLEDYKTHHPDDGHADKLIESIRDGNVRFETDAD